ncbi:MAG: 4-hydroxythreonine-4-phosphate dehydrogenase PdxA [Gammaproteobacteria bacterium]|nr:4-hydroxythreonine-4-phosphate dehydrogenase PdxA [Gammaproteobacteria bacterium]
MAAAAARRSLRGIQTVVRIAISVGEPAGIGPDIVIRAAPRMRDLSVVLLADPELLSARARLLGLEFQACDSPARPGGLSLEPIPLARRCSPGSADPRNAAAVLQAIDRGAKGCLNGEFDALVTGPVNKAVLRRAGLDFMGHTEHLARLAGAPAPVMLLACEASPGRAPLRVALATTHLPLSAVPAAITRHRLRAVLAVLLEGLERDLGIARPRVAVLGLNPHAGEQGELGSEDQDVVARAVADFGSARVEGPMAADTAFTPAVLSRFDAVLAMYHDQGLPVIKYAGFGRAVNVTLGLPFVRTSVDHGTAFELAGTGRADEGSLLEAVAAAARMARRRSSAPPARN